MISYDDGTILLMIAAAALSRMFINKVEEGYLPCLFPNGAHSQRMHNFLGPDFRMILMSLLIGYERGATGGIYLSMIEIPVDKSHHMSTPTSP